MKKVSAALQSLINEYIQGTRTTWYIAELYTFWLNYGLAYNSGYFNNGIILLYTGHDTDLSVGGNRYYHWPIAHGNITEKRGVEVADCDLTINYNPYDKIYGLNGITWFEAVRSGIFDGCYLSIDRLYSPTAWKHDMPDISVEYVLKSRFFGRLDIQEALMTSCKFSVKSPTELLNTSLPRNLIKPSCLNKFCDNMCGLNKNNYTSTVTAQSGSSKTQIVTGLSLSDGYYSQGNMLCTSGANQGVTRTIKIYSGNIAYPVEPFNLTVNAGDTFTMTRGCSKTIAACQAYGNMARFRGYPYLPHQNCLL